MARWQDPGNFTGLDSYFEYINGLLDGYAMSLFVIVIYVVLLSYMIRRGNDVLESLVASTYGMAFFVGVFYVLNMLYIQFVIFFAVWTGIVAVLYVNRKE